jgi:hypothetical protein
MTIFCWICGRRKKRVIFAVCITYFFSDENTSAICVPFHRLMVFKASATRIRVTSRFARCNVVSLSKLPHRSVGSDWQLGPGARWRTAPEVGTALQILRDQVSCIGAAPVRKAISLPDDLGRRYPMDLVSLNGSFQNDTSAESLLG